jgi:hypothetical protein
MLEHFETLTVSEWKFSALNASFNRTDKARMISEWQYIPNRSYSQRVKDLLVELCETAGL